MVPLGLDVLVLVSGAVLGNVAMAAEVRVTNEATRVAARVAEARLADRGRAEEFPGDAATADHGAQGGLVEVAVDSQVVDGQCGPVSSPKY
mgnify:CR=1 FL=1